MINGGEIDSLPGPGSAMSIRIGRDEKFAGRLFPFFFRDFSPRGMMDMLFQRNWVREEYWIGSGLYIFFKLSKDKNT